MKSEVWIRFSLVVYDVFHLGKIFMVDWALNINTQSDSSVHSLPVIKKRGGGCKCRVCVRWVSYQQQRNPTKSFIFKLDTKVLTRLLKQVLLWSVTHIRPKTKPTILFFLLRIDQHGHFLKKKSDRTRTTHRHKFKKREQTFKFCFKYSSEKFFVTFFSTTWHHTNVFIPSTEQYH